MSIALKRKQQLLIKFYNPCKYRGVYYVIDNNGKTNQFEKNSFGTKRQQASGIKPKFPFRLNRAIKAHLKGTINFAMLFNKPPGFGNIIAFDLDSKDYPEGLLKDVRKFQTIIRQLGIEPLIYHSGGKGYHVEIRTQEETSIQDLATISKWLRDKAIAEGVRFMDRYYPYQKPAYRIFGSWKLSNKNFTKILTHYGLIGDEEENWQQFEYYMRNYSISPLLVKELLMLASPQIPEPKEQKEKPLNVTSSKRSEHEATCFSIKSLLELYHKGLMQASTRHNISFQLGRLFRYYFNLSQAEAVVEIRLWVNKHFSGRFRTNYISTTQEEAVLDSIKEVQKAYTNRGYPFTFHVLINENAVQAYIKSLQLTKPLAKATDYLLDMIRNYKKLIFSHSQEQFMKGWELSINGAKKRINVFLSVGLLKQIEKGSNYTHKANVYKLILPDNCYSVIEEQTVSAENVL